MPISPQLSLLIILVVGLTTFVTRAIPFLIFPKWKGNTGDREISGQGVAAGGDWNAGRLLFEIRPCGEFSLWAAGAARDYGGSGFTRLETE